MKDEGRSTIVNDHGAVLCERRFTVFVRNGDAVKVDAELQKGFAPLRRDQDSVTFTFYRTLAREPRYTDEPGCEPIGTLTLGLGDAMKLPFEQRRGDVVFRFGETEIRAHAAANDRNQRQTVNLRFDVNY